MVALEKCVSHAPKSLFLKVELSNSKKIYRTLRTLSLGKAAGPPKSAALQGYNNFHATDLSAVVNAWFGERLDK